MSEEQQKQPAIVSREDLYRQVWETPMLRLGEQYGISGNGLKKICDRLQVPYPPPGHWAKLRAGKSVTRAPLPDPQSDTPTQVTITPTPPPSATRVPELDAETGEKQRIAFKLFKIQHKRCKPTGRIPREQPLSWLLREHSVD